MRMSDWSSDVCSSDLREQRQAGDQHAGDGAGAEGDGEALGEALAGSLRRAHVGAHRDVHADVAGGVRKTVVSGKSVSGRVTLGGRRILYITSLILHLFLLSITIPIIY